MAMIINRDAPKVHYRDRGIHPSNQGTLDSPVDTSEQLTRIPKLIFLSNGYKQPYEIDLNDDSQTRLRVHRISLPTPTKKVHLT